MATRHRTLINAPRVVGNCLGPRSIHIPKSPLSSKTPTISVSSFAEIRLRPRLPKALPQLQSYSSTPASRAASEGNTKVSELRSRAEPAKRSEGHATVTNTLPGTTTTGEEKNAVDDPYPSREQSTITNSKTRICETVEDREVAPGSSTPSNMLNSMKQAFNRLNPRSPERTEQFTRLKRTLEELELQQAVILKLLANENMAAHQEQQATNDRPPVPNSTTPTTEIKSLSESDFTLEESMEILKKISHVLKENQALNATLKDDMKDIKNTLSEFVSGVPVIGSWAAIILFLLIVFH
ncbi:MAG: hypothetical protein Q9208_001385 [Pyrenodesmia sp. 3 TL-2023]